MLSMLPATARAVDRALTPRPSHAMPRRAVAPSPSLVAFDLTLPGLDSRDARRVLAQSLGAHARIQMIATDRRHGCFTLNLALPREVVSDVIGVIIARFTEATIGRMTPVLVRR